MSFRYKKTVYRLAEHRENILHSQWAGGVVLLVCSIAAMLLANFGPTAEGFHHFWEKTFTLGTDSHFLSMTLEEWVNDCLMVVFFFVVGLEIKREIIAGQLSSVKKAGLPIAAAIGGMIFPAILYLAFNYGTPTESGWGIPMATDIAFALGVLSLLGRRVPFSLKIFLTALAIVDDLGAILVIAFFYSTQIAWSMLLAALVALMVLIVLNRMRIYQVRYYVIPSILLWYFFLHSGIHATISGVIIAMTLPSTPRFSKSYFIHKVQALSNMFNRHDDPHTEVLGNMSQYECLQTIRKIAKNAISPAQRIEYALHHVVTFFIMPVFALANAGVKIDFGSWGEIFNNQTFGIFTGLVVGKPVGIFLLCFLTVKLRLCVLPENVGWGQLFSVTCLGGIGFTMSIFINNLAFSDPVLISSGKVAILAASLTAALVGWGVIKLVSNLKKGNPLPEPEY